jgi:hypothetical protein
LRGDENDVRFGSKADMCSAKRQKADIGGQSIILALDNALA